MDRLRRLLLKLRGEVCFWICNHLDEMAARPTTNTRLRAADAVAIGTCIDIHKAFSEPELPPAIAHVLSQFSNVEWQDVMTCAGIHEIDIEEELKDSRWAHLRYKPPGK